MRKGELARVFIALDFNRETQRRIEPVNA